MRLNTEQSQMNFLRALDGAAHTLLFAFAFNPKTTLGTKQLTLKTGRPIAQVTEAIKLLEVMGWIENTSRYNGWRLSPGAGELVAMLMNLPTGEELSPAAEGAACADGAPPPTGETTDESLDASHPGVNFSTPPLKEEEDLILRSKDLTSSSLSDSESQAAEKNRPKGRINGRSSPQARSGKGRKRHQSREAPIPAVPGPETAPAVLPAANAGPANAPAGIAAAPAPAVLPGEAAASGPEPPPEPPDPVEPPALAELSPPEISVRRLLAATEDLFGEPVLGWAEDYPDPHRLLAWIAQAYGQRRTLKTPARMVYRRMHEENGRQPAKKYQEDPCAFLPASFLRAAGLPVPPEDPEPEEDWTEEDWPEEAVEDEAPPEPPPDDSLSFPVRYSYLEAPPGLPGPTHVTRTSACAWATAMNVLQSSLDGYSFRRFTAGVKLRRYEPEACRFVASAPDEAQRALAEDRLAALLRNILRGICGEVEVAFEAEGNGDWR